jgi:Lipocalin-like domain
MAAQGDRDSVSNVREQIIGTWELVSAEEHMTDGSKRRFPIMGASGKVYLMYSADGYMFAAGMNPDRPAWKDGNKPTATEKLRAIEGFFAYCGRYEIDEAKQVLYLFTRRASVDLTNAVFIRCSCLRMKTIRHFQVK